MTTPTSSATPSNTASSRRRWALLAGVPLAAALLGAGAIAAHAHGGMGPASSMHGSAMGGAGAGPMAMPLAGRGLERLLDRVDATAEQRTQIRAIAEAARADLRAQAERHRGLRDQALQLFAQPSLDANAAEAQRQQMLQQHDQASRRTMQAMLDIGRVLTPQQRATLVEQARERRELMQRHWQERQQLEGQRRS